MTGHAALGAPPVISLLPANSSGAEIQMALDALPPNGEVVLSPGTYEISQPLMLRHDDETLRGSGPATILHLADEADCPVVILGPPMAKTRHPATHLHLADLLIDGNRKTRSRNCGESPATAPSSITMACKFGTWTGAAVEHVICCRCRSGGLVTAWVRRLQVNDLDSYDNQFDGLACYRTEESRFDGLRLHDNLGAGLSLDLAFNSNCITNAVLVGNDLGIFMRDSRNNSFQG